MWTPLLAPRGDFLLRIRISFSQVISSDDEVLELIRVASVDLILRVCYRKTLTLVREYVLGVRNT